VADLCERQRINPQANIGELQAIKLDYALANEKRRQDDGGENCARIEGRL
jgi:hypothetical protein